MSTPSDPERLTRILRAVRALADPDTIAAMPFGAAAMIGARVADLLMFAELAEDDVVVRIVREFDLGRPVAPASLN